MFSFSFSSSYFPLFSFRIFLFVSNHEGLFNTVPLPLSLFEAIIPYQDTCWLLAKQPTCFHFQEHNFMLPLETLVSNTFFIHHSPCKQYFRQYVSRQAEITTHSVLSTLGTKVSSELLNSNSCIFML